MKINLLNVWVKAVVSSARDGTQDKTFRVKFENQKYSSRCYSLKQLAYANTPQVIIPVGTRIIGKSVALTL